MSTAVPEFKASPVKGSSIKNTIGNSILGVRPPVTDSNFDEFIVNKEFE
jgi:hypothetical protein